MYHEIETIKFQCYYCRDKLHRGNRTRDHVHPKSKGGKLSKSNKVFACRICNSSKGSLSIEEWLHKLENLKQTGKNSIIWKKRYMIIPVLYSLIQIKKNAKSAEQSKRFPRGVLGRKWQTPQSIARIRVHPPSQTDGRGEQRIP